MTTVSPIRASLAPYETYPVQEVLSGAAQRYAGKTAVIDGERTFTYRDWTDTAAVSRPLWRRWGS